MRYFFKKIINHISYRFGFQIKRFKSGRKLYFFLEDTPLQVFRHELNSFSSYVASINNHQLYQEILQLYIPGFPEFESYKFIAKNQGGGNSCFHAFRKVSSNKKTYFEKIYYSELQSFLTVKWMNSFVFPLLKDQIELPEIKIIYEGNRLHAVYFKFFDLKKEKNPENELIRKSWLLYKLSLENKNLLISDLPSYITNFTSHFEYQKNRQEVLNKYADLVFFEKLLVKENRFISHGDMNPTNIYKGNILLDWDNAGLFPLGFDPAFIFFRLLIENYKTGHFENWVKKNYKALIRKDDWEKFKIQMMFFLLVFGYKHKDRTELHGLEEQVVSEIQKIKARHFSL